MQKTSDVEGEIMNTLVEGRRSHGCAKSIEEVEGRQRLAFPSLVVTE
jgi:hypothetical protein